MAGYWVPVMAMGCPPGGGPGHGWHAPPPPPPPGVGPWFPTYTIRTGLFGCACVRPSLHHVKHFLCDHLPHCPPCPPPCLPMPPWQQAYGAAMYAAGAAMPAPAPVPPLMAK